MCMHLHTDVRKQNRGLSMSFFNGVQGQVNFDIGYRMILDEIRLDDTSIKWSIHLTTNLPY